jgi:hypothetical protein
MRAPSLGRGSGQDLAWESPFGHRLSALSEAPEALSEARFSRRDRSPPLVPSPVGPFLDRRSSAPKRPVTVTILEPFTQVSALGGDGQPACTQSARAVLIPVVIEAAQGGRADR